MSSVIDGIRQAQCLAIADAAESCSRSGGWQRRNIRSPKLVRVLGTMHVNTSAERRRRRNSSETRDTCVRYGEKFLSYKIRFCSLSSHACYTPSVLHCWLACVVLLRQYLKVSLSGRSFARPDLTWVTLEQWTALK